MLNSLDTQCCQTNNILITFSGVFLAFPSTGTLRMTCHQPMTFIQPWTFPTAAPTITHSLPPFPPAHMDLSHLPGERESKRFTRKIFSNFSIIYNCFPEARVWWFPREKRLLLCMLQVVACLHRKMLSVFHEVSVTMKQRTYHMKKYSEYPVVHHASLAPFDLGIDHARIKSFLLTPAFSPDLTHCWDYF